MAKAFAFIANTATQNLTSGAQVNPGTAVHGFGKYCGQYIVAVSGNSITLRQCPNQNGYYAVEVGATVSASEAANVTLALYQDGALVSQGSETIAAANDPASIAFPAGVLVTSGGSVLTLVVTASTGTPIVTNIESTITKL